MIKNKPNIFNLMFLMYVSLFFSMIVENVLGISESKFIVIVVGLVLQFYYLSILFKTKKHYVSKFDMFLLIIYALIMMLTFAISFIIGSIIDVMDLLDVFIKLFNFFIMYVFMKSFDFDTDLFKVFCKKIAFISIAMCLINFVIYYDIILNFFNITSSYQINLSSLFENRNTFGMFLFISSFSILYLLLVTKKRVYLLFLLFVGINIFLTMSRGAIGSFSILVFYVVFASLRLKYKLLFGSLGIILFLSFVMIDSPLRDFAMNNILRIELGTTGRSDIWRVGINLWSDRPFFGFGYYSGLQLLNDIGYSFSQFHNFFIDNLIEGGIFMLIFKLFILISTLFCYFKKPFSEVDSYDRSYVILLKGMVFASLFLMLIESINIFALGFAEIQFTIFLIAIPILFKNYLFAKLTKDEVEI